MLDSLSKISALKLDSAPPKEEGGSETLTILPYGYPAIGMPGTKNLGGPWVQFVIEAKGQGIREPTPCSIVLTGVSAGIATCVFDNSSAYYTGEVPKIEMNNHIFSNGTSHIDGIVRELKEICVQYQEDWDGYGAQPISEQACHDAERFVKMLPESVELPEITPVPDGDIVLEWYGGEKKVFFVTFHGNNTVEYIGAFGGEEKVMGRETMKDRIPESVLHFIGRINSISR